MATESPANYRALNKELQSVTEQQALAMLEAEKGGAGRSQFLVRIYGTYNKLRCQRERLELVKAAKK